MSLARVTLVCGAFWIGGFGAVAQNLMGIEQVIQNTLENNYGIKILENTREIAENDYSRGNAGFLPVVDLGSQKSFRSENVSQVFINGNENERDGAKSDNWNSALTANWIIFDGMRMFHAYERLGKQLEVTDLATKVAMENTVALALTAYYTIVIERERIKVLENSIQLSERRLEIANNKFELGKVSKVEYLTAQVDYNADKALMEQGNQLLYQAKVDLYQLMGLSFQEDFDVLESIDINQQLVIDKLLESANMKNPSLLQAQRQQNIAHLQMQETRAERLPILSLGGGYVFNSSNSEAGFLLSNRQNGYNYGLAASFNIFNGFNLNRRIQNTRILMESAEYQMADMRLSLESDIKRAFNRYRTSLSLIDIEQQNLEVARENESIAVERYQLGNSTSLELREAQVNAVQTESRLINAAFSTKLAEIELLRLSGSLIQTYSE